MGPTVRGVLFVALLNGPVWWVFSGVSGSLWPLVTLMLVSLVLVLLDGLGGSDEEWSFERDLPARIVSGRTYRVLLRVRGPRCRVRRVRETIPLALAPQPLLVEGPFPGEFTFEVTVRPSVRGDFDLPGLWIEVLGRFGLASRWISVDRPTRVSVVLPIAQKLRSPVLRARWLQRIAGRRASRRPGAGTEFHRLRELCPGDDPRLLDWKASARRERLIVREHAEERGRSVVFVVDAGATLARLVGGRSPFERALTAVLTAARALLEAGDRVGVTVVTSEGQRSLPVVSGPRAARGVARFLNDVHAGSERVDLGSALLAVAAAHRRRILIVLLTDGSVPGLAARCESSVDRWRGRHRLLVVDVQSEELDGRRALPESLTGLAMWGLLEERRRERILNVEALRKSGIRLVSGPEERLAVDLSLECLVETS